MAIRAASSEPSLNLQRDLAMVMWDLLACRAEAVALDIELDRLVTLEKAFEQLHAVPGGAT